MVFETCSIGLMHIRPPSQQADVSLLLQFGTIQQLEVLRDQETGQSLGTGHLTYANSQAASAAVSGHSLPKSKQHWPQQLQDIKVTSSHLM